MSVKDEFKAFIMKADVVDPAIVVVAGGAFDKIITAFVNGIVMPIDKFISIHVVNLSLGFTSKFSREPFRG